MIKTRLTRDGKPILIFGLSELNVQKLKENKPISFDLDVLGLEGTVIILYGETEESITQDLKDIGILPKDMPIPKVNKE